MIILTFPQSIVTEWIRVLIIDYIIDKYRYMVKTYNIYTTI